ncbi:MAG: TonB-dependent receptor [Polyangiales bacterium]
MGLVAWVGVASAQDLLPPELKRLAPIELPTGVELPDDPVVRVVVQVNADGTAVVETCDADRAVCDVIDRAMHGAEFAPATRDGEPVPSRVRVDLRLKQAPAVEEEVVVEEVEPDTAEELVFSEVAEVDGRNMNFVDLKLEAIRNIPGTLGDPYRTLLLMPCVTPITNGQPYGYVCGAPPAGTAYLYDNIRIPLLFHSTIGAATIHPAIIRDVNLFTSAPGARYGRFTGGVMSGSARSIPNDRVHGEVELRAIDASAMLNVPIQKDGSMTFSGRYGFPNLLLGALNVDATVDYWDYQYRADVAMSPRSRFQIVAFGSKDNSVVDEDNLAQRLALDLEYHRVETRFVGRFDEWEVVGTLLYGYDRSVVDDGSVENLANISTQLQRFGPRFWAIYAQAKYQVRLGGDVAGLFGPINCVNDPFADVPTPCDPDFAAQDRRVIGGVYGEVNFAPAIWVDLSLGVRGDIWGTSGQREAAASPRARVTFHAKGIADVYAGWGLGFLPATYSIPLPGLGDVPLEPGLQRANQTEVGIKWFLPGDVLFETRAYINLFNDIRFVDVFTNPQINQEDGFPVGYIGDSADGKSYGMTLLLQRPFDLGFSAFGAYTLGYNDLTASAFDIGQNLIQTFDYTPSYDVRHVINAVLAWQAKFGLTIGARLSTRSGRTEGWVWLDADSQVEQYTQRISWFTRLDAQVAYEWARPGRRMRIALEWVNITQARDAQELSEEPGAPLACSLRFGVPSEPCPIVFTTAIWYPNLSFRATF